MKWHGILVVGLCMSAATLSAQTRQPSAPGGSPRPAAGAPSTSRPAGTTGTPGSTRPSTTAPAATAPAAGTTKAGSATGTAPARAPAGTAPAGTAPAGTAGGAGNLNARDYASYAIGLDMAARFQADGTTINIDQLILGLKDGFGGAKPRYPEQQLRAAAEAFDKEMQARAQERFQQVSEKNKQDAAVFLAENKKKKTVRTTASGLQYEVIKAGTGKATAKATDTIKAHYHGTLIDGTVFDTTQGDQPVVIEVASAIAGWTEALQLMRAGDKWRLYVPSELAYGPEGFGPVPPNAVLVFELELLEIAAPAAATPVGQGTLPRQIK
ncbi:MAG: FKBP-type peptidyl-prolyl cis-trans isomerase [Pirellulales bacterium]